jgi:precorrin-2 methylase
MRIGIVGGLDRNAPGLASLARAAGHEVANHNGVLAGRASSANLTSLVRRSDVVFIVTDVNSHNAVLKARKVAKLHHRAVRLVRRLGMAEFSAYLGAQVGERAA